MGPMDAASTHRREIHFRGMVQGVGFRYTMRRVAERFAVSGFVQNLPDGRVRAVVEGTPEEVERFLGGVRAELGHYVSDEEQTTGEATGEFRGFGIRM